MNAFYEHHKDSIRFAYRCFDRILLNGLIQPFQQPERVVGFFNSYRDVYPVSRDRWGPLRARCGKTETRRRVQGRMPRPAPFCASTRFDERRARLLGRRKALLAALLAATLAVPALAQLAVNIVVAPPAPVYEPVPATRPGFVWAPGYWVWWGNRYVWWRGYWIPTRAGWAWHPGWWAHNGPSWRWHPGWWGRA
jgi:hypothetical protein